MGCISQTVLDARLRNIVRSTIRCYTCGLNQFVTSSGNCRRCSKTLYLLPESEPEKQQEQIVVQETVSFRILRSLPCRIRTARLARNMTQEKVSLNAGYGRATLSRFEKGSMLPSPGGLLRIAGSIGVPIAGLLSLDPRILLTDDPWIIEIAVHVKQFDVKQRSAIITAIKAVATRELLA